MSVELVDGPDSMQESITVRKFASMRKQKTPHALLDVREAPELAICSVNDSLHIPMGQVAAHLADLPQNVPLVVMCHLGVRSMRVVQFLRNAGWQNAMNLEGGIDAWSSQIDPAVPRY